MARVGQEIWILVLRSFGVSGSVGGPLYRAEISGQPAVVEVSSCRLANQKMKLAFGCTLPSLVLISRIAMPLFLGWPCRAHASDRLDGQHQRLGRVVPKTPGELLF